MKYKLDVLLLIGFIILILGACKDSTMVDEATNKAEVTDNSEEKNDPYGGTLNFAYNAQPPTLDPTKTTANATRDIVRHIYEQLVTFDRHLEVQPMLAESYEVDPENNTITFELRKGIKFHNGEEMLAEDVVASMEKWATESAQAISFLEGITFEQDGDNTVIAKLEKIGSLDMFIFADVTQIAAIMPKEIAEKATEEGVTEYIGTGPYQFEEWKQDQYIHLTRFDDYQPLDNPADGLSGQKSAFVDEIYFHIVTDPSTRVAGLQSGNYHIANVMPYDSVDVLARDENIVNIPVQGAFPALIFNKKEGVFSDKQMRQAVAAALNVEEMMLGAYTSEDFFSMHHELMLETQTAWYTDAGKDQFDQRNTEKARELLREAGYIGEDIRILTSREYDDYYTLAIVAQQQLRSIGMNVVLDVVDWSTVLDLRAEPDAYDMFITSFDTRPTPVQYPFLDSRAEWPGWTDSPKIDELIDGIVNAADQKEAQVLAEALQGEVWDYLPIVKLGNKQDVMSMRSNIHGFDDLIGGPILWNVKIEE